MNIHQLSVTYQPEHDRVLLRVNTTASQEMRLWLTRRLLLGLWPLLGRTIDEQLAQQDGGRVGQGGEARRMLAEMHKAEFMRHADFDTPYKDSPTLPLGEEPLLVTQIDAGTLQGGQLRLGFVERIPGTGKERSFQMEMAPALAQGLAHLLGQALAQSGWREAFAPPPGLEEPGRPEETEPTRPRYLN